MKKLTLLIFLGLGITLQAQSDRVEDTRSAGVTPPGVHSDMGSSVTASEGGYGIFGNSTGSHIAIDGDDIQRKSSATSYSTLYLN